MCFERQKHHRLLKAHSGGGCFVSYKLLHWILPPARLQITLFSFDTQAVFPCRSEPALSKNELLLSAEQEYWSGVPLPSPIKYYTTLYIFTLLSLTVVFLDSSVDKEFACNSGDAEDVSLIPGSGKSPGEGHATHSSILAWKIPWTEEPSGLQSKCIFIHYIILSLNMHVYLIYMYIDQKI